MQQIYPSVTHPYQFELNKDFNFSAAHYIPFEEAGKCIRTHGHTYYVNLTIAGNTLDKCGFLVNFRDLKSWFMNNLTIICLMTYLLLRIKVPQQKLSHKRFTTLFKKS